jgi:hypothetical protein
LDNRGIALIKLATDNLGSTRPKANITNCLLSTFVVEAKQASCIENWLSGLRRYLRALAVAAE